MEAREQQAQKVSGILWAVGRCLVGGTVPSWAGQCLGSSPGSAPELLCGLMLLISSLGPLSTWLMAAEPLSLPDTSSHTGPTRGGQAQNSGIWTAFDLGSRGSKPRYR